MTYFQIIAALIGHRNTTLITITAMAVAQKRTTIPYKCPKNTAQKLGSDEPQERVLFVRLINFMKEWAKKFGKQEEENKDGLSFIPDFQKKISLDGSQLVPASSFQGQCSIAGLDEKNKSTCNSVVKLLDATYYPWARTQSNLKDTLVSGLQYTMITHHNHHHYQKYLLDDATYTLYHHIKNIIEQPAPTGEFQTGWKPWLNVVERVIAVHIPGGEAITAAYQAKGVEDVNQQYTIGLNSIWKQVRSLTELEVKNKMCVPLKVQRAALDFFRVRF